MGDVGTMIFKAIKIFWGLLIFFTIWQGLIYVSEMPKFILPSPIDIAKALYVKKTYLLNDAKITGIEIILGMICGSVLGIINALLLQQFTTFRKIMKPIIVVSQTIPVYALAPILVLWLGYDLAPKIVMAVIIIFFPVTTTFYDGLMRTPQGYLDIAKTMGANNFAMLFKVRFKSALPELGSGLRVAAALAPIGAIVGEWVGASEGLGYRMIYSNAQLRTDEMFAALFILVIMALSLYYFVDYVIKIFVNWKE